MTAERVTLKRAFSRTAWSLGLRGRSTLTVVSLGTAPSRLICMWVRPASFRARTRSADRR